MSDGPLPALAAARPSPVRAWLALVWLSLQRQMRMRQMVWIALGLLLFSFVLVSVFTAANSWTMKRVREPFRSGPTLEEWANESQLYCGIFGRNSGGQAISAAVLGASRAILEESDFLVYSRFVVFSIFLSFLLPLWSLSFATESLGGERESNSLIWLLTRPLPRPAIYLAKFVALLPWSLGLNLGGFALLCLAGGRPGLLALRLYWPAVLCASLAFSALFFLFGAWARRPAVLALVYSFFLEVIFGNMPGYLKRISISFYTHCMMYDAASDYGVQPEKPSIFLPVDGSTALAVLLGLTVGLLLVGMFLFARTEYHEVS
jgi:ABC-type transport system involved in multi-copper enzyme maturation permease subunit